MSANGVKLPDNSRRQFLSAALLGLSQKSGRRVTGSIVDDSHLIGHRLRDRQQFAPPKRQVKIPLLIVGGGVAGISAAWRLQKRGFRDFIVVEMEKKAGGNSRWDENEISPYPWAAHYLPIPNRSTTLVRELAEECGLIEDGHFSERHLCHSPQERLFIHGRWQEGLEPEVGVTREQKQQFRRFDELIAGFKASGQFTIPIDLGAKATPLDQQSMSDWLRTQSFDSPYLQWYIDYACRDDYGASTKDTSAWAGIHYFAAREHEERGPFTWPEGNGWLMKHLLKQVGKYVQTANLVTRMERTKSGIKVISGDTEYQAQAVIWAAPTFLLRYVLDDPPDTSGLVYSPWITANLTLDRMPSEVNTELAWDNVIYGSQSLGYVVATHQSLRSRIDRSVWTWYFALAQGTPAENRRMLLEKDWNYWSEFILNDLARPHPDIRQCVSNIDVMRLGHAMVRPVPGWMHSEKRKHLTTWGKDLILANSDLSGISIFEEAQYRGVTAADRMLRRFGRV